MASHIYFLDEAKAKSRTFLALKCQVLVLFDLPFSAIYASS